MAILEAGLIVNGLPLIRSVYYSDESNVDPIIKTSLVTVIQSFASETFNDRGEEINLKKISILIRDLDPESNEPLLLYSIIEKGTDKSEVKRKLAKIKKKLDLIRMMTDTPVMTNELIKVKKIIDKELRPLVLKPSDRAKSIFG
ncbi:MAG: hypothetical protein JXA54_11250 [Candidatus Heimdallarchaeota archaeon]|nr:hypothetical protein [Candidatus Heimdallarchaeota archaeon]